MYYSQIKNPFLAIMLWLLLCLCPAAALAQDKQMQVLGENHIQDAQGRDIKVEEPYQRIVSLYGAHTENLFSLGLEEEIKGVGQNETYPPAARDKPAYSYREGPEKILSARPDLVLIRPMIDQGYSRLIQTLERSGITVVSLQPGNVQEMFTYWKILGILTDRTKQAREMQKKFQAAVQHARELTESVQDPKKVFFEAMHNQLKTFAPESMPIFALESAGGNNVAHDAQGVRGTNIADFGIEPLLSRADQVQVYLAQEGPMNQPSKERIKNRPGLHMLQAVQENEIYIIKEELVSRPTLRLVQGITAIGKILYPDIFTRNIRQQIEATALGQCTAHSQSAQE